MTISDRAGHRPNAAHRGAKAEFHDIMTAYARCDDPAERERIDESLWARFGATGVAFISDMSRFSKGTRARGICHCLGLIYRMRDIVVPLIQAGGGRLLKCETDNCYAFYDSADAAIATSIRINAEIERRNQTADDANQIYVSMGMDYGELLLLGSEEFYGDPVNTASKLAEDLAGRGETLISDRLLAQASTALPKMPPWQTTRISGIDLRYITLHQSTEEP